MTERVIIDPHLHFFALNEGNYHWLKSENPPFWNDKSLIQRDFSSDDLYLDARFKLKGFVHIEAGFDNHYPCRELEYLSQNIKHIAYRAIAYLDITQPTGDFKKALANLTHYTTLAGIRDITEGEDATRLLAPNVVSNLALLASQNLIFEAQFELAQTPICHQLVQYCKTIPNLKCVINHAGLVTQETFDAWQANLAIITTMPNIWLKVSGFEIADRGYQTVWLQNIVDTLLQHFSANRLMFASNFPLCLFSKSYLKVWQDYQALSLLADTWQAMSHDTALHLYQLS